MIHLAAPTVAAGDIAGAQWQVEEIRALEPGFRAGQLARRLAADEHSVYRERLVGLLGQAGVKWTATATARL